MSARRNLCPNPSFEVDLTGWDTNGTATITRDTSKAAIGSASCKLVVPAGSSGNVGAHTSPMPVEPGKIYTFSVALAGTVTGQYVPAINWLDASQGFIAPAVTGAAATLGPMFPRSSLTAVAPPNAAFANVRVLTAAPISATDTLSIDAVLFAPEDAARPYFDGDTPDDAGYTYAWDGAANESTSTATSVQQPAPPPNTSRRAWPYPDLRNGATICHISDTHMGTQDWPAFAQNWLDRVQADLLDSLKITANRGYVHTGDMINGYRDAPGGDNGTEATIDAETGWYTTWRDAIKTATGLPFAEAVGNHDMLGPFNPDGTRAGRTSQQWAESVGLTQPNNVYTLGDITVITLAPDEWLLDDSETNNEFVLSDATLDWLDTQLSATTAPVFLACHVPPMAQYAAGITADGVNPRLDDLIGAHANVIGFKSGHRHALVASDQNIAEVVTIAGRQLFALNAPSTGGVKTPRRFGGNGNTCATAWVTLLDDHTLDVRWRNHLTRGWMHGAGGLTDTHRLLTRS